MESVVKRFSEKMRLPLDDMEFVMEKTASFWSSLKGKKILMTGGTGFFGMWLTESIVEAIDRFELDADLYLLTRDARSFEKKSPRLYGHGHLKFIEGDIRSVSFPDIGFSHIIHGATSASEKLNRNDPLAMYDTIVTGTRRMLDFAGEKKIEKLLFLSSGAVYGKQPHDLTHIDERYMGGLDIHDTDSAYALGKSTAEFLCSAYAKQKGLNVTIARCFAFVGPYLPLDAHFAVGNFIKDKIMGRTITVKGDGTPYRSYLYMADLAVWLITLLFAGKPSAAYNVGSQAAYSISEIAQLVARSFLPFSPVEIRTPHDMGKKPERYVPDTEKARNELGLREHFSLEESIRKTVDWYLYHLHED